MNHALLATASLLLCAVEGRAGFKYISGGGMGLSVVGDVYGNTLGALNLYLTGSDSDAPANLKFTCRPGMNRGTLLATPCSGTTPQTVRITIDPGTAGVYPGTYHTQIIFTDPSDSSVFGTTAFIDVTFRPVAPPVIGAVVSAASLQPSISPGEVISVFGSSLGAPFLAAPVNSQGFYTPYLANAYVTFNGVPSPVLFNNTTQMNAVVPYSVAGQKTVQVVVWHYRGAPPEQSSPPVTVPVADTSPGIFTLTQNGSGQGAILNDGATVTVNGATNPAPKGSIITLFGTGAGLWNPPIADGLVLTNVLQPPVVPQAAVSLSIGGQPAPILYAGAAPGMVSGVLQVNAVVPNNIGSGAQPVVLSIGPGNNAQQSVTLAIQ